MAKKQKKNSNRKAVVDSSSKPEFPTPTPLWLRRFILGFAAFYGILCLTFIAYSLYGRYGVVEPAREALADGSPEALAKAVDLLQDSHVFSGFEPYHGFGSDQAEELAESVERLVAAGEPYTDKQRAQMVQWASHWVAAAQTHKVQGDVPWVEGDAAVLASLLERWENALATSRVFLIYLAIVALVFLGLFVIYWRKGFFERIGPLES